MIWFKHLHVLLHKVIFRRRREIPFIIFASFLFSFVFARVTVWTMERYWGDVFALHIKGVHVHHFNYGIALIVIVGFITLSSRRLTDKYIHWLSFFYGVGLGIMFDEFALFMRLDPDGYWTRHNYDAIAIITLVLINIVYFREFWSSVKNRTLLTRMIYRIKRRKSLKDLDI